MPDYGEEESCPISSNNSNPEVVLKTKSSQLDVTSEKKKEIFIIKWKIKKNNNISLK